MHITVQKRSDGPVHLELCGKCSLYHCPFCQLSIFKPRGDYSSVWTHIESHRLRALQHGEFTIFICYLECRGKKKHFHCPFCPKNFINRIDCQKHIGKCQAATTARDLDAASKPPSDAPVQPLIQTAPHVDQAQDLACLKYKSFISSHLSLKSNDPRNPDYTPTLFPHLSERARQKAVYRQTKFERSQQLSRKRAAALAEGVSKKTTTRLKLHTANPGFYDLHGWSGAEHDYCVSRAEQGNTAKAEVSGISTSSLPAQTTAFPASGLLQSRGDGEAQGGNQTEPCTNRSCQATLKKATDECHALRAELAELAELQDKMKRITFSEEAFEDDDEKVRELTGLPSYARLMFVFTVVLALMPARKFQLSHFQNFIMTLMYLKLHLPFQYFMHVFLISKSTTLLIFNNMLGFMHDRLSDFIKWPSREPTSEDGKNRNVTTVIECFEIPVETQSRPRQKHLTSVKYIIATTPEGVLSFVSAGWPGEMADTEMAEKCGLLEKLSAGDVVVVGHKFDISDSVSLRGSVLRRSAKGLLLTDTVSRQLRDAYVILKGPVHFSFCQTDGPEKLACLDKIVTICCVLHNVSESDSPLNKEQLSNHLDVDGSTAGN